MSDSYQAFESAYQDGINDKTNSVVDFPSDYFEQTYNDSI